MFSPIILASLSLHLLLLARPAAGRERWLARDDRPVYLYPRRFGQENPDILNELRTACSGQVCGTLAGQAVSTLLAAAGECTQQDLADSIIDAGSQFDSATQAKLVSIAIAFRQVEKNTPPDFTTNPPTARNSVFCQKAPKNSQLNGLVQAQDPANDLNVFFDPATKTSVLKGSQSNTSPFGSQGSNSNNTAHSTILLVTRASNIGDFGSCSVPQIKFGVGFDNRKETSFEPADQNSFNHGSAQNIDIITQFICDTLTNKCGADQTAKDTCSKAIAAADTKPAKTGAQADAFNAAFGESTNFASVAAIDNQGNVVGGGAGGGAAGGAASSQPANAGSNPALADNAASNAAPASSSGVGNFGSCSVPQIKFGVGFDARKETSFEPADLQSFNHGSAQNIDIISKFICDTLTNKCGADQTAKDTCAKAITAADTKPAKTGAQADAFNAAFGVTTNFASIAPVDDQGNVVASGDGAAATGASASTPPAPAPAPAHANAANAGAAPSGASGSSSSSLGNFGSCPPPEIEFGVGFDGRKESSFQPSDKAAFNHGSAQNIDIITQFVCDTLTNKCGADQTAKDTCAKAKAAADTKPAKTGAQADAFNAVLGIQTNFASVSPVDDQGNVVQD